jgi:hypothetical protein
METNTQVRFGCQNEITEECIGEHHLWTAVVTLAVQDWRMGSLRARREAQRFLFENDGDFYRVCASAGLDPSSLRCGLLKISRKVQMEGPLMRPLAA